MVPKIIVQTLHSSRGDYHLKASTEAKKCNPEQTNNNVTDSAQLRLNVPHN